MGENNPHDERTSDARIGRRAFLQAGVATVGGVAFGSRAVVAQESGSGDAQCALGPFRQASPAFPTSTEEVADAETASDRSIRVAGRKPSTRLTPLAQGSPAWDALRGDSAGTESPAPGGSSRSARAQASVAASASTSTTTTAEGRELAVGTEYEGFDYRSQLRETPEGPRAPIPPDPQIATGPDYHVVAVNWMWGSSRNARESSSTARF